MEKKPLASMKKTVERPNPKSCQRVTTICLLVVAVFTFITSVGMGGYFVGQASANGWNLDSTVNTEKIDPQQEVIDRWTRLIGRRPDRHNTVEMTINEGPSLGTCVCTVEELDVHLLQHPDPFSDKLVLLEKGSCFRYLRTFQRQTEGLVYYLVVNTDYNLVGWISSKLLQTSENCSAPLLDEELDPRLGFAPVLVPDHCLQCICKVESNCQPIGCRWDVGSKSCGYFQIKENYWIDCGKPGKDLKSCADDIYCSSMCVQKYMRRYVPGSTCPYMCQTYAREHNGGPKGCRRSSTIPYWNRLIHQQGCGDLPVGSL